MLWVFLFCFLFLFLFSRLYCKSLKCSDTQNIAVITPKNSKKLAVQLGKVMRKQ